MHEAGAEGVENMAMDIVDKIPRFELAKVPVGDALRAHVGTAVGDTLGALVIRFAPASITSNQYFPAILKLLLAAGFQTKWIKGIVGPGTADVASLIFTYEGIGSVYNVRSRLDSILARFAGKVIPAGTTSNAGAAATSGETTIVV